MYIYIKIYIFIYIYIYIPVILFLVFFMSVGMNKMREGKRPQFQYNPLTCIGAITPFDTWFHVTRRPTGWTTKTRNRGSRYKWPPSGRFFRPAGERGGGTGRGADQKRFNGVMFFYLNTMWRPRWQQRLHKDVPSSPPDNDGPSGGERKWLN